MIHEFISTSAANVCHTKLFKHVSANCVKPPVTFIIFILVRKLMTDLLRLDGFHDAVHVKAVRTFAPDKRASVSREPAVRAA